jgi:hypothetical protein
MEYEEEIEGDIILTGDKPPKHQRLDVPACEAAWQRKKAQKKRDGMHSIKLRSISIPSGLNGMYGWKVLMHARFMPYKSTSI